MMDTDGVVLSRAEATELTAALLDCADAVRRVLPLAGAGISRATPDTVDRLAEALEVVRKQLARLDPIIAE